MSPQEYHWPARPAYIRRGTPVTVARAIVACTVDGRTLMLEPLFGSAGLAWQPVDADGDVPVAWAEGATWLPVRELVLDLRDLTARVHAAAAWAGLGAGDSLLRISDDVARAAQVPGQEHTRILLRMRMMDETVTLGEVRAALHYVETLAQEAT